MATQKVKNKKLDPIPKINRRLFKLWSEAVRSNVGHKCEYCNIKRGDINQNNKKTKIDAHHFYSRDVKNCPLKWDIRNGIALCPEHHKFSGDFSAHRASIIFYEWVRHHYPENYNFIINNYTIRLDLQNRAILEEIEKKLRNKEPLDLERLKEIATNNPRQTRSLKAKKSELEKNATDKDLSNA